LLTILFRRVVEASSCHRCDERQRIPIFAIVGNETVAKRYERCVTHFIRISTADDATRRAFAALDEQREQDRQQSNALGETETVQ
jgi:hypothetical protein